MYPSTSTRQLHTSSHYTSSHNSAAKMFSAALRSGAAPLRAIPRKSVAVPAFRNAVAGRKVTTDAASAHADKESVPEVC